MFTNVYMENLQLNVLKKNKSRNKKLTEYRRVFTLFIIVLLSFWFYYRNSMLCLYYLFSLPMFT